MSVETLDERITDANFYKVFQLIREKRFDEAQSLIDQGLQKFIAEKDLTMEGLYYSAQGVLHKMRGDFKNLIPLTKKQKNYSPMILQ